MLYRRKRDAESLRSDNQSDLVHPVHADRVASTLAAASRPGPSFFVRTLTEGCWDRLGDP
jgi:hypothetical protein